MGWGARLSLTECTPSKGRAFLLAECANPANFPVQAGSLTCAATRATGMQGGVTTSRDGKLVRFANVRVSANLHSPTHAAESLLDGGKSAPGSNEGLLASRSGKTNTQAVG